MVPSSRAEQLRSWTSAPEKAQTMDRHQHDLQWQFGPWTSASLSVGSTDINIASGSNTDPKVFLRRQSRNEPFFISDILLLVRVRVIMQLGSMLGAVSAQALGCCIPPCTWFPASTPGTTTMLVSPKQGNQHERRSGLRPETSGGPRSFATPVSLVPFLSTHLLLQSVIFSLIP